MPKLFAFAKQFVHCKINNFSAVIWHSLNNELTVKEMVLKNINKILRLNKIKKKVFFIRIFILSYTTSFLKEMFGM